MTTFKPLAFALFALLAVVPAAGCLTEGSDDTQPDPAPQPEPDQPQPEEPEPGPESELEPEPARSYGQECSSGAQCAGGLCLSGLCSQFCDIDEVDSCQQVEAFCVPLESGAHGCYGFVDTGHDADGAIITIGDVKAAHFGTLGDADLFRLDYWRSGEFEVVTQGDGVDLQIEFHNTIGEPIGVFSGGGRGNAASALATIYGPTYDWLVVRNVGNTTGPYSIGLSAVE